MADTKLKNGRSKCGSRAGRPCKDGRKGGKNSRGGCTEPVGRPCTAGKGKAKAKPKGKK